MKHLAFLSVFALTACPDWDGLGARRCRELGLTSGACEGTGETDAGEIEADGGRTGNSGTSIAALPQVSSTNTYRIYGDGSQVRLPVFLWELPVTGVVVAVESYPGHINVWRSTDSMMTGDAPQSWCAAAASDRGTEIGNAYPNAVSVDELSGPQAVNADYRLTGCVDALAAYQRADAGISYLGITRLAAALKVQRTSCDQCNPESTFNITLEDPLLGEAVTDEGQTAWISAAGGPNRTDLYIARVDPEAVSSAAPRLFASSTEPVKIELSTSGGRMHAAWLAGQQLSITELSLDGGLDRHTNLTLSEAARLVDLVETRKSVVAVLEFSGGRNALLIHQATSDWLFRIATPALTFRPAVAHLGSVLRIAGQCDGGAECLSPVRNPLLEFARLPDGGSW